MRDAGTPSSCGRDAQVDAIWRFYGDQPRISDWFTVTQELIDQFGIATCDSHWIHSDPVRARQESPYGTTVAQGFWTLSMLSCLSQQLVGGSFPPATQFGLNYGLERVRFPAPVPVGARIRLRFRLVDVEARSGGRYLVRSENVMEVEGQDKPALIAEWLFLLVGSEN